MPQHSTQKHRPIQARPIYAPRPSESGATHVASWISFVSGVGTVARIPDVGHDALKPRLPGSRISSRRPRQPEPRPSASPAIHLIPPRHRWAGIIPDILDRTLPKICQGIHEAALRWRRTWRPSKAIPIGISGGAPWRRHRLGKRNPGKRIVVIIPDFAERYLATVLFEGLD